MTPLRNDDDGSRRAPWFDRLVAWAELHPFLGQPLAFSTMLTVSLVLPALFAATVTQNRPALVVTAMLAGLTALVALAEGTRGLWRHRRPYASPRWLRAVRGQAGDAIMDEALAKLMLCYRRDPDYIIRRSDLIEQVRVMRSQRRDAAKRARGVFLSDARPAS